jgi:hypothetical protein
MEFKNRTKIHFIFFHSQEMSSQNVLHQSVEVQFVVSANINFNQSSFQIQDSIDKLKALATAIPEMFDALKDSADFAFGYAEKCGIRNARIDALKKRIDALVLDLSEATIDPAVTIIWLNLYVSRFSVVVQRSSAQ